MWWIVCAILLGGIGLMVAGVVLWIAWQIVRFILNLICSLIFGQDEVF